jgi:hypothetical protein
MLRTLAAAVVLSLAGLAWLAQPAAQAPRAGDLAALYAGKQFFELRDALAAVLPAQTASPDQAEAVAAVGDLSFFQAAVAARFNRLDEAERLLEAYIEPATPAGKSAKEKRQAPPPRFLPEAYAELMGVSRQRHQYARIVETRRRMLTAFKGRLTRQEINGYESGLRLWRALRDVAPQTVEITGPARLPWVDGLDVAATFEAGTCALEPNTGSAFSIIIRSEAKRLGFRLIDQDVGVNTGTGGSARAALAVAPPMRLGPTVVVRNAVFLVFPDEALQRPRQQRQRRGTIGAPVLSALGAVTFSGSGLAFQHFARHGQNAEMQDLTPTPFFFNDTDLVVSASYAGRPVMMVLDTGAADTSLSALFFRDFGREVRALGRREWHEFGSVGGARRIETYSLPTLQLTAGGRDLLFPGRRVVLTEPTGDDSRSFHGWFGRDLLSLCDRVTIDYGRMAIALR